MKTFKFRAILMLAAGVLLAPLTGCSLGDSNESVAFGESVAPYSSAVAENGFRIDGDLYDNVAINFESISTVRQSLTRDGRTYDVSNQGIVALPDRIDYCAGFDLQIVESEEEPSSADLIQSLQRTMTASLHVEGVHYHSVEGSLNVDYRVVKERILEGSFSGRFVAGDQEYVVNEAQFKGFIVR